MKTKLFNFIIIGTLLMTGVVSAWEEPESIFPDGNANAPVHTGDFEQRKSGGFWSKYFYAGTQATTVELSKIVGNIVGFVAGNKVMVAPTGIFTRVLLPGNNAHLRVGTIQGDDKGAGLFNAVSENPRAPAVIDLRDRSGSHQVDAVAMLKNSAVCTTDVAMVTNTPAIHFWSDKNNSSADLIARQIRLVGGNPTSGSVLVSVDSLGNAVWGIPKMVKDGTGWVLQYDYNTSPVKAGLSICENVTPVNVCPNLPNGPYTSVPSGYRRDSSGNCIQNFCPNISSWTGSGLPSHAGVVWTGGNGNNCIPNSCDTTLIGTSILGVTVGKSNDCPVVEEREWKQMATPPVLFNNPLFAKSPGQNVNKSCSVFYENSQYDTSNGVSRLRVLTRNNANPKPLKVTDFNINNNQVLFMSYDTRSFGATLPNPNITQQGNCLYKATIEVGDSPTNNRISVACKVLPYGQTPQQDTWDEPQMGPSVYGKQRNWYPAHSCMEYYEKGPIGSGHGYTVGSFEAYNTWPGVGTGAGPGNGGSNYPRMIIEGAAYSMEYLFPQGADNLRYFK